jgi:putative hemolysin
VNRGRALGTIAVAACLAAIAACSETAAPTPEATGSVALANPAAEHCAEQGGRHVVETAPTGDAFGVCYFEDNRQCEAWALLRGECRTGGIRVTGYATPAARFCAITGGNYAIVARSGAADEQGTCALPTGNTCDADAYYRMTCSR